MTCSQPLERETPSPPATNEEMDADSIRQSYPNWYRRISEIGLQHQTAGARWDRWLERQSFAWVADVS